MFTGLIENQGKVLVNDCHEATSRLIVSSGFEQLQTGESIAVNGVCLTLLPDMSDGLAFDISPETMSITTLGALKPGDTVNLERAMSASSRFGGHYVSGHVDTTAQVKSVQAVGEFVEVQLHGFDSNSMLYLLPKGSIAVEGVSLTINDVTDHTIKLMLVPHTLLNTNLHSLQEGQQVNIEFDYLTRIVAQQLQMMGKMNNGVTI